jgi:hypothetical protein
MWGLRRKRRNGDEFPEGFRVQRIKAIDANTLSDLPASDIVRYFRENSYAARTLLAESADKRFTPSSFIVEESNGLFRVGWFTTAVKYECVKEFQHLEDAATDYLLFSLGKGRWTPPE